ncbi:SDR family NAD(P)-dependent oxidoreductase [Xenorhabdus sp. PB62.4]|uniref:SDR family NAD(P)-dependent oxidoreductase n=1 Tax=Xenorhabdus sp. PB62.4 TaxID=1851573 RepID=UPI001656C9B0|nr:SDR family NAD(P)-dependent oxidoreductase [Xenorhabdus sp. PB62.4]MBC8951930.1 putative polyketide synthase [Xenorhabdus sp. PB62.4]
MNSTSNNAEYSKDIAIIGVGLRLPQTNTLAQFWHHLTAGRSLISEVTNNRWHKEEHFGDPRRGFNKTNSIWGGFVSDIDCFDAAFFQISPREAEAMDPQQRMALELSWHALEDAGYRADKLAGSRTGVYMGVCHWDYAELIEQHVDEIDAYYPTGTAYSIIANRVSHYFDFQGPSVVNDTACSSSLVAVQQAVQALLLGDCDYALAGGFNLCWSPRHFIAFSKAGMLSRDGQCRAFDAGANGYVRGEGGGVIMLKRATDARRDGDPIYALIKGVGSNHGGRTSSLTVTNPNAQAELIVDVFQRSGIAPDTLGYVEAHGPGTPVGDPIEILGLKKAFSKLSKTTGISLPTQSCGVGSVKSNIGHLEGAAGIAGIFKVIMAMRHRQLPATINFKKLNPLISLDETPFYIVDKLRPWTQSQPGAPLRASVSSFGFGGTNAYMLLEEELTTPEKDNRTTEETGSEWLPLSAQDEPRLLAYCAELANWVRERLAEQSPPALADIAHTLRAGRVPMRERVVFEATSLQSWAEQLEQLAQGQLPSGCWRGRVKDSESNEHDAENYGKLDNEDIQNLATNWLEKGNFTKFAIAWAHGGELDWSQWPIQGQRLHLPGYTFARIPYWFRPTEKYVEAHLPAHPLLGVAKKGQEGDQWQFSLRFDQTLCFLRDHLVNQKLIVPGVMVLELVSAAAKNKEVSGEQYGKMISIHNVVWIRPLVLLASELSVQLSLKRCDGGYDYKITDDGGTVYSQGRLQYVQAAQVTQNLDNLLASHTRSLDVSQGYAALRASGIEHGSSLQGLVELHVGNGSVIAKLQMPQERPHALALQPAMLDSALQAALALGTKTGDDWGKMIAPSVPFALDILEIHRNTSEIMWAWLRPTEGNHPHLSRLDIDLFDESGYLCQRLIGYTARPMTVQTSVSDSTALEKTIVEENILLEVTRTWYEAPSLKRGELDTSVLVINAALDAGLAQDCVTRLNVELLQLPAIVDSGQWKIETLKTAFNTCYKQLQHLMQERGSKIRHILLVASGQADSPAYAPLASLLKTMQQEKPSLSGKLVLIDEFNPQDVERFEHIVREESVADHVVEVSYDKQNRRWLCRNALLSQQWTDSGLLRDAGIYWITGGTGALGLLVGEYLCRNYNACVIFSGRSAQSEAVAQLQGRLDKGQVHYQQADVTRLEDIQSVFKTILTRFGRLNGIFHAAGVLDDGYLINKPLASCAAVLAPKLDGTVNLDRVTRNCELDFMLLFGSVAGVFGNAAQADYGVANAFLDSFALQRQQLSAIGERHGVTRVIDWPLWRNGGMQVDNASLAYMFKRNGTVPLPDEQGLMALERALWVNTSEQRVVLFGQADKLREYAGLNEQTLQQTEPVIASENISSANTEVDDKRLLQLTNDYLRQLFARVTRQDPQHIHATEKLERYGIDSFTIVDMTSKLEDSLGSLPKTLFFEYINLQGVASYLIEEHRESLLGLFAKDLKPQHLTVEQAIVEQVQESVISHSVSDSILKPESSSLPLPSHPPLSVSEASNHDIAVIGMAGRYPGADTLEEFWQLLSEGRHSFQPWPESRWPRKDIYFGERDVLGKTVVKSGTFLNDIANFDPRYFNISQRDAELLSPEVRLFLQAGVTAFEDAGYSRETLRRRYDSDIGVMVGSMNNSYSLYGFQNMLMRGAVTSGSEIGVFANMLSYYYGFTGPSIFIDTMCSSSSACVHQAIRMLRNRECRMMLVGGINLMVHPFDFIATSQAHFTSKEADVLRSYGLGADGTILGEGVGALVLKPLTEAEADGDPIYGVIKGSGMTNAGIRNGFSVPSPQMQARAIERALDDAGLDARTISYFEGHGSATSLGDPIEIKGASLAFSRQTQDKQFCAIGSVKSNIGHLLSGSGLVGLTKVLLQMKNRTLVPSLHSEELNPSIEFTKTPFVVQRNLAPWQRPRISGPDGVAEVPLRAGVTSIGAGGVNVHIVVEEHVVKEHGKVLPATVDSGQPQVIVFSAMTPKALAAVLNDLRHYVNDTAPSLDSLAYTLQTGKNELPCRLALVAHNIADVSDWLERLCAIDWTAKEPVIPAGVHYTANILQQRHHYDTDVIEDALHRRQLDNLTQFWCGGAELDWDLLWPQNSRPLKLSLPAYPFEKVYCWYPEYSDAPSVLQPLAFTRRAHPWVGVNCSDVKGICYELTLRSDELLDYVYTTDRQRRYVTLALLDGALAFTHLAGLGSDIQLRQAQWGELPKSGTTETRLQWRLLNAGNGSKHVELVHLNGLTSTVIFTVYLTAQQPFNRPSQPELLSLPLEQDQEAFYAQLAEHKIDAKPYQQCVDGIVQLASQRLLVYVSEPEICQDPHKQQVRLTPWVAGAILQGLLYLSVARHGGTNNLTASQLGSLQGEQFERTRAIMLDWAFHGNQWQADVTLLDEQGHVLGLLAGLICSSHPLPQIGKNEGIAISPTLAADRVLALELPEPESNAVESAKNIPQPVAAPSATVNQYAILVEILRTIVADLLKFDLNEIDADTYFYSYGFESIALAKLSVELNTRLGSSLTPAIFFECPNIRSLSEHIVSHYADELKLAIEPAKSSLQVEPITQAAASTSPVQEKEQSQNGAVAIVGMAGRFPDADDLDTFWQKLCEGADMVTAYPGDRFDKRYEGIIRKSDFPKWAGQIKGAEQFDADFFYLSRLEAELMDPQHRLALETVWSALEDGGYAPARLPENTGVYFGVSGYDYHQLLNASGVALDAFTATGNAHSMLANRISYLLDIHGPSEPVDTACSSSLVALHRAVESIRSGRCDMAIAGGVNLLLSVDTFVATQMAGMLSPDGRCKTFSAGADGYVRSEGVVALLLKPLAAAQRDGDSIWGIVIGSAENHGGRASSLTAPNSKAQTVVIEKAMQGIDPDSISYIETHGTGTSLGDLVEVTALGNAYRNLRTAFGSKDKSIQPLCTLGSVKTNIGHAEAAAGLAGVLKVLLAMRHGELPPTLHCTQLNQDLPLAESGFEVVRERRSWIPHNYSAQGTSAEGTCPLRAAVSSFGFGGANAHVVLESPPQPNHYHEDIPQEPQVILLSARDGVRLRQSAANLCHFLEQQQSHGCAPLIADLAYTLQIGREPMEQRLGFAARSINELCANLRQFLSGTGIGTQKKDLYTGSLRRSRGTGVMRDLKLTEDVANAMQRRDLNKLLAAWCVGEAVDWQKMHLTGKRHIVQLPGYPFARDRYWAPDHSTNAVIQNEQTTLLNEKPFNPEQYLETLEAILENRVTVTSPENLSV